MKVEVTRSFPWARDGVHQEIVMAGTVVEGRAAAIALELGHGRLVEERPAPAVELEAPQAAARPVAPGAAVVSPPFQGRRGRGRG